MVLTLVASLAIAAAQPPAAEDTDGWIAMNSEGRISVNYDREPDSTYTCHGPIYCRSYLELVDGLAPGERKRIGTQGQQYFVEENGDLRLGGMPPPSPGAQSEISFYTIEHGSPQYQCYRSELGDRFQRGSHMITLTATRRVQACLNRLGTAAAH